MGTNSKASEVNTEKLAKLLPNEQLFISLAKDSPSSIDAPAIKESLPYTTTGQLPSSLHLKKGAPIMITANSKVKKYKENGICNGARGYIHDIYVETDINGVDVVSVVWVKFIDNSVGKLMKQDLAKKDVKYRNDDMNAVPIIRESTSFKYHGYTYRRTNAQVQTHKG